MTVHGAKGLEAPVVILADATADPARMGRTPITLDVELGSAGLSPLLRPKKEERCPPFDTMIAAEEKRDLEEHWRLLYVALTRAADRLVSGVAPKPKKDGSEARPENCWHVAVERAMVSVGADQADHGAWGPALVYGARPRGGRGPGRDGASSPPRLARLDANGGSSGIASAEAACSIGHRRRSGQRAAAERRRCVRQRFAGRGFTSLLERLPEVPRISAPMRRIAGSNIQPASLTPIAATDRRTGLPHSRTTRASRHCSAGLAGGGAACGDPAGRASHRRNGRSSAGRRRARVRAGLQDRPCACTRSRHPCVPPGADGGLCRGAAGDLSGETVRAALLYTAGPRLFELPS